MSRRRAQHSSLSFPFFPGYISNIQELQAAFQTRIRHLQTVKLLTIHQSPWFTHHEYTTGHSLLPLDRTKVTRHHRQYPPPMESA